MPPTFARFDIFALHGAMDARRRRNGLTWREVARELGMSSSTLTRAAGGGPMEADGVMTILSWLGLPAVTFLRPSDGRPAPDLPAQIGNLVRAEANSTPETATEIEGVARAAWRRLRVTPALTRAAEPPPDAGAREPTRIDTAAVFAALDSRRRSRAFSWRQVADEIGAGPSTAISEAVLTRLARNGRTWFPSVMFIVQWLGVPVETFLRPPGNGPPDGLMDRVSNLLHARSDLPAQAAAEIEGEVRAVCERLQLGTRRA